MKEACLIAILLTGCAGHKPSPNVQEGTVSLKDVHKEYLKQCKQFPYPDIIYVDQCFEFDCDIKKFVIWDPRCNESAFTTKIVRDNKKYFKVR